MYCSSGPDPTVSGSVLSHAARGQCTDADGVFHAARYIDRKGVGWHEQFEKENVPISAEQWADVEQVVLELYPLMKPKPEPRWLLC